MQFLKNTGKFWCERGLISCAQSVKSVTGPKRSDECELEELDTDTVRHWFYSTYTVITLPSKLLKCFEALEWKHK
jgi:hypothetical protein